VVGDEFLDGGVGFGERGAEADELPADEMVGIGLLPTPGRPATR
jgi:hypothetical protein